MALEASDRLIDIIWVNWRCTCGCTSRPTFKLSASLLDTMGKSKEISQDLRKKIVDLHKSGLSLGAISKCLKEPRSSVRTIVRKYKHHGTTQPSYRSGRRRVLFPRDERTLVRKVQINPKATAKDLEDVGGNRYRYKNIYILCKTSRNRHNLKGRSARKKTLHQHRHKKARLHFATAHGDKDCTFWRNILWSDGTKI